MEKDHLRFKGRFMAVENQKNILELSVGLDVYRLLLIVLIISFFVLNKTSHINYFLLVFSTMLLLFLVYKDYSNSKKVKELFFDYLEKIDPDYEIISNKSY